MYGCSCSYIGFPEQNRISGNVIRLFDIWRECHGFIGLMICALWVMSIKKNIIKLRNDVQNVFSKFKTIATFFFSYCVFK